MLDVSPQAGPRLHRDLGVFAAKVRKCQQSASQRISEAARQPARDVRERRPVAVCERAIRVLEKLHRESHTQTTSKADARDLTGGMRNGCAPVPPRTQARSGCALPSTRSGTWLDLRTRMTSNATPGRFQRIAHAVSRVAGNGFAFAAAVIIIIAWAVTGPLFHFSDTWQLVINTSTTIVTFLMVFLIQNTQNREAVALQIKLDELIRATRGAHNVLLDLEELDDIELLKLHRMYRDLASRARAQVELGGEDTGTDDVHRAG
jgi:low affinity Fe/Cu permease